MLTCAAADDITAWCILATVIAIVNAGSFESSLYVIALAIGYVVIMLKLVRPFLKRIGDLYASKGILSKGVVAIFLLTLIISSYLTEIIGIHAVFGAFMAGAVMPDNAKFRHIFIEKVEDVAVVLFLPLFFVYTGLKADLRFLADDPSLFRITGWIILVAVVGKFAGSAVAAKFVGQSWRDSLVIGALMNTRGLMELVVLNIGLQLEVISPQVFTMMVIMALVTTFMTGPALDIINKIFKTKDSLIPAEIADNSRYKILISFGDIKNGKALFRLAHFFTKKQSDRTLITALHLAHTNEINQYNIEDYEKESFEPVLKEAEESNREVSTFFKASNDIDSDITKVANQGEFDILLIGLGQSIFEGSLLGKILGFTTKIITPDRLLNTFTGKENIFEESVFDERTRHILEKSEVPVGILVDKGLSDINTVFFPIFDKHDTFLIYYAQKLINNCGAQVTILDTTGFINNNIDTKEMIRAIEQQTPNHITILNKQKIDKEFLQQQDLMLVSLNSWKNLVETRGVWLSHTPSTLIIQK